jgi:hypothetical protein
MRIRWRIGFVWVVLAGLAALPWAFPRAVPKATPPSSLAAELATINPWVIPDLAVLSETTSRPLFIASRRPAPLIAKVKASAEPPRPRRLVGYRLTGIVRSSTQRLILLTEEKSGRVVEVHEGEKVDGWSLMSIDAEHVRLSRDGHEIDLLAPGAAKARRTGRNTRWLPNTGTRK